MVSDLGSPMYPAVVGVVFLGYCGVLTLIYLCLLNLILFFRSLRILLKINWLVIFCLIVCLLMMIIGIRTWMTLETPDLHIDRVI